ncbi:MAG: mechanosensitive ion channel family protein [Calditrichaceae bacterium]
MEEFINKWLFDPTTGKLITLVIGVLVIIVFVRFLQKSLSRYIKETDNRYRARKFISFIGYIAVVLLVSTVYSDKLGGLTVALGVAGAGIAFALQEVIASVAGWFAISFANFYKTGDRVLLGGIKGDVIDIGVLRTTIMEIGDWVKGDLYNGRVVRIANSFVFKEPVFNYSGDFPFLWDEIAIPVRHGCDHEQSRALFRKAAVDIIGDYTGDAQKSWNGLVKKYMIEDAAIEPVVTLTFDENWMTFTIRYVVEFKKRRITKDRLFSRILDEISKTNGEITIASAAMEISLTNPASPSK